MQRCKAALAACSNMMASRSRNSIALRSEGDTNILQKLSVVCIPQKKAVAVITTPPHYAQTEYLKVDRH